MSTNVKWEDIVKFYRSVFYKPDLKVLRIVLSCCCAHYLVNEDPVWLFVVAPSSAGKSSQIIEPLSALDLVIPMDVINSKTFINAYDDKNIAVKVKDKGTVNLQPQNGVLFRLKGKTPKLHGIITFSDFSMFTSLKSDERALILAQFRKIYDGQLSAIFGNNRQLNWEGKVTMIVAGTPEVEKLTGNMSDVGDRFIKVRMMYPYELKDRLILHKKVMNNLGNVKAIRNKQAELIKSLVEGDEMIRSGKGAIDEVPNFSYLIQLCLALRRTVSRDRAGKIVDIGRMENAGRITSAAVQLARGSAMLDRRKHIMLKDLSLAMKVIIDNIPEERWFVVRDMFANGEGWAATDYGLWKKYSGDIPYHGMMNLIDELEAMNVIEVRRRRPRKNSKVFRTLRLTDEIRYLMEKGFKDEKLKNVYVKEKDGYGIRVTP